MIAGLPGTGIGGFFYMLTALWMPVRETGRALRGQSSRVRWSLVGTQGALAIGVIATAWVTGWVLTLVIPPASINNRTNFLRVAPIVLQAAVLGTVFIMVHLLRLVARPRRLPCVRTAIVNDTHGVSAIAWDALDADLVVACGDHPGKMQAAYYLAERGVNVYTPTNRVMGMLIGAHTKSMIVGSAPVKRSADGAVIGEQAISLDVDEPIVVSTTRGHYPFQYYDSAYRYFKALEAYASRPLKLTPVELTEYGKAEIVVDAARRIGAKVIGMRVRSQSEHDAVYAWLKEDGSRRAVLFHTATYPEGYRLFFEFPGQTSFGDIHPVFE
jgi:hypothetical protein